ncbi:unnamed protein product [Prorocentrum cordatum]|uniref:Uncharacterized protein n=1 Tax=Prorocentrum cordatum TaxID=2364126 RepID=A0ABN9UF73_9DINO|nr:unnamed protein product [Polarella glacialis]
MGAHPGNNAAVCCNAQPMNLKELLDIEPTQPYNVPPNLTKVSDQAVADRRLAFAKCILPMRKLRLCFRRSGRHAVLRNSIPFFSQCSVWLNPSGAQSCQHLYKLNNIWIVLKWWTSSRCAQ